MTTWNPIDNGAGPLDFDLIGSGGFFANGGFELGINLNGDTLNLDKALFVNAFSNWLDANAAGSVIATSGSGLIVNNDIIDVQIGGQLDITVPVVNDGEIDKSSGAGTLSFGSSLSMQPTSLLRIDAGAVNLSSTLALGDGAILEGFGTVNGNVFSSGGIVNVDGAGALTGTLTINGDLTLDSNSTVVFDFCETDCANQFRRFLGRPGGRRQRHAVHADPGRSVDHGQPAQLFRTGGCQDQ